MKEQPDISSEAEQTPQKERKSKKLIGWICIISFLLIFTAIFYFVGKPMIKFADQPESFRAWVDEHGIWGRLVFTGMMALQIIVAVIPGEPLEITAGYAFGMAEGTLLCMLGAFAGGTVVFLFVRYFGIKVVDIFIPREKITQLKFLNNKKRLTLLTTIVFLIPGTPKDILTYFAGLTPMKLTTWMLITTFARLPSIITSTAGGNALGTKEYAAAALVFAVTVVASGVGLLIYKKMSNKKHSSEKTETEEKGLETDDKINEIENKSSEADGEIPKAEIKSSETDGKILRTEEK